MLLPEKLGGHSPSLLLPTGPSGKSEAAGGASKPSALDASSSRGVGVEEFVKSQYTREMELDSKLRPHAGKLGLGAGLVVGDLLVYGTNVSGLDTGLHEYSHATAVNALYDGAHPTVQVDGFENIGDFLKNPSGENLAKALTGYDRYQDGAAGYTSYSPGTPSELGTRVGPRGSAAIVSAAGSLAQELPVLSGWVAGFKLRHKHPFLGYTLMTASTISHFTNMLYPWSAIGAADQAHTGHDWAAFAAETGINPALTAAALTLSLPAVAVGLYLTEHHAQEKMKDHLALARLINNDQISPDDLSRLKAAYGSAKQMNEAEERMHALLSRPLDQVSKGFDRELSKASKELRREYDRFSDFVISQNREQIDQEKKQLKDQAPPGQAGWLTRASADLKQHFAKDKLGAALETGTIAGAAAVTGASALRAAGLVSGTLSGIGGAMGGALSVLAPGVGVLGAAHGIYRAAHTFADPSASQGDKATAASVALFTTVGAVGAAIPGLGLPIAALGLAGVAGTYGVRWLAHKIRGE